MLQHTTRDFHRIINHKNGGNSGFASAHHMRLASGSGASRPGRGSLPQHTTCGLHRNEHLRRRTSGSFASAHHMRLASGSISLSLEYKELCLSTPHAACIVPLAYAYRVSAALPQHTTCGLHRNIPVRMLICKRFASAHHMRLASSQRNDRGGAIGKLCLSTPHAACIDKIHRPNRAEDLCLSTPHAACIKMHLSPVRPCQTLPQHTTCGLHRLKDK